MFRLFEQVFIGLLSFSSSFTTKCLSLNEQPCMIRLILIDLNPVDLNFYPLIGSLQPGAKFLQENREIQ